MGEDGQTGAGRATVGQSRVEIACLPGFEDDFLNCRMGNLVRGVCCVAMNVYQEDEGDS